VVERAPHSEDVRVVGFARSRTCICPHIYDVSAPLVGRQADVTVCVCVYAGTRRDMAGADVVALGLGF